MTSIVFFKYVCGLQTRSYLADKGNTENSSMVRNDIRDRSLLTVAIHSDIQLVDEDFSFIQNGVFSKSNRCCVLNLLAWLSSRQVHTTAVFFKLLLYRQVDVSSRKFAQLCRYLPDGNLSLFFFIFDDIPRLMIGQLYRQVPRIERFGIVPLHYLASPGDNMLSYFFRLPPSLQYYNISELGRQVNIIHTSTPENTLKLENYFYSFFG